MTGHEPKALEFRIGQAFPANDLMAQYVMRLSMALGDLRTAIKFAVRSEQPEFERIYFVRLTAQHLREVAVLFDPPDRSVVPGIEDFIRSAIPSSQTEWRGTLRRQHRDVLRALRTELPTIKRTLKSELDRLRHGFAHYHRDSDSSVALEQAMADVAEIRSRYTNLGDEMRAAYADEVTARLMHPFVASAEQAQVRELHTEIVGFVGVVAEFLQHAEAYYLRSRADGVVRTIWKEVRD